MKKEHSLSISYVSYEDRSHLEESDALLLDRAIDALDGSYAPYSKFNVGAAVLMANDQVVIGANQENAAFPSGLCAERVATFAAKSQFPDIDIVSIAIVVDSKSIEVNEPSSPCGACRQSLLEFEVNQEKPVRLILGTRSKSVLVVPSIKSLLPLYFDRSKLGI